MRFWGWVSLELGVRSVVKMDEVDGIILSQLRMIGTNLDDDIVSLKGEWVCVAFLSLRQCTLEVTFLLSQLASRVDRPAHPASPCVTWLYSPAFPLMAVPVVFVVCVFFGLPSVH